MKTYMMTLILWTLTGTDGLVTNEQPENPPAKRHLGEDATPEVIHVVNARVEDVAAAINGVIDDVVVEAVASARAVIINGPPTALKQARDIAKQLDDGMQAGGGRGEPVVVAVRNRDAGQIEGNLARLLGRQGLMVASDRDRGALVMSGPDETLKQAKKLVEQLDAAPRSVMLEFAFFQTAPNGAASAVPADLADVAKELERFGQAALLGRLSTVSIEGQKFSVNGGIAASTLLRINGEVVNASDQGMIRIKIEAETEMQFETETTGKAPRRVSSYGIRTTLVVSPGVYTVLGVAPCGETTGQTGILVIRAK